MSGSSEACPDANSGVALAMLLAHAECSPRGPRPYGANRHPQNFSCLVVAHAFEADQQDHPALGLRQFPDRSFDIEKVEAGARLGLRERKGRAGGDPAAL